jgi:endogenous inhibitor of DNA gyrase (YacG/DUF329 family)
MITAEIKCPQCRTEVAWQDNPHRPFCSERCRVIDLGHWADESYRVAGSKQELFDDDNVVSIYDKKQDTERS